MNQQSRAFKVVAILLVIVAVVAGAIYITEKDRQEKVQEEKRIQLQKEKEQAIREHQEAERKAEAEKQRKKQEIINRTENAKRNRLDPAKADWKVAYSASLQQQKTYIRVDDNGDNIYINEDGNVMALIATSNEGKFYNKYGEIKKHDANEYLVFVEEIDLKNDRQRLVDCYKYYADAKAKGLLDYDWRELGGGNWEKMINTIPNYYDWLRKNYDSFYKLGT